MARRAFVLSIDGATFDQIRPLAAEGRLPHFARLLDEGAWGGLRSVIQPITPAAWVSFMTGMNPGRHGIYDFTERQEGSYVRRLQGRRDFDKSPVWMVTSREGRDSIVLNVPFTYPPDPVQGQMISGFDAPVVDESVFHPPGLKSEVESACGTFLPDWTFPTGRKYDLDAYLTDIKKALRYRTDVALHLMKTKPWDFFMVHYQPIDHVQHVCWSDEQMHCIHKSYEAADAHVGEILDQLDDETNLFVISDHGFGEIQKFVFLGEWLRREGFLFTPEKGASTTKAMSGLARATEKTLKRLLPFKVRGALRRAMPGMRDKISSMGMASDVDWSKSRAYATGMYGNVCVNLRGREPQGIVPPEEYETTRDQLIESLMKLRAPDTGEEIIEKVWRREELYDGTQVHRAPDLLIEWKDYSYYTELRYDQGRDELFGEAGTIKFDSSEYAHNGTHRMHGILFAKGPDIQPGADLSELRLIDVAPTILYLMGLGIPEDMDGRVLHQLIREEFRAANQETRVASTSDQAGDAPEVSDEAREAMEERLRGLGYMS